MTQVIFSRTALKDLRKVPAKEREVIKAKLQTYAETGQGDIKKLQGSSGYRLRHGDWRALFEIKNGILVIRVLKRGRAYR